MFEALLMNRVIGTWFIRIFILFAGLGCFVGFAAHTQHRWEVSMHGIPATIQLASKTQTLPTDWNDRGGVPQSEFYVDVQPATGGEFKRDMYLSKGVIEALLRGENQKIIYARDNQANFIMQGEPYSPFGFKFVFLGISLLVLFGFMMKVQGGNRYD